MAKNNSPKPPKVAPKVEPKTINWPSKKTGKSSGGNRSNNPPKK